MHAPGVYVDRTQYATYGATTPSRVSVVLSEAFLNPNLPPAHAAAFAQAQEYVVRDPVHVNWPEITQRVYNPTMDLLWSGSEDAATVGARIKEESDALVRPELTGSAQHERTSAGR